MGFPEEILPPLATALGFILIAAFLVFYLKIITILNNMWGGGGEKSRSVYISYN